MKDESKAFAADENDVADATKAFEKLLTDFSANKKRLEQIDTAAKELEVIFPEWKKDVSGRARETDKIYGGLVKLQEQQKKNLGSASGIFFQKSCKRLALCFRVINHVTFQGEDVCHSITEKSEKLENDDLAKDLTTVKALQRKHKEIEGEFVPIKDKVGQVSQLVRRNHFKAMEIGEELTAVNSACESLVEAVKEQGSKLVQAEARNDYNGITAVIKTKKTDIKSLMTSTDTGEDMRRFKKLLSQHTAAEAELTAVEHKVAGLGSVARKEALSQSMKFHEFNFDLQRELEWISEKVTIVSAPMEIQT